MPTVKGVIGPYRFSSTALIAIVQNSDPRIKSINVTDELISAELKDGRVISVPLVWSWRLSEATPSQRANYEIIGDGEGVHWEDVDEDISAEGMLQGVPARRANVSAL